MSCPTGKIGYANSSAAARVMKAIDSRHNNKRADWHRGQLSVYRCASCGEWHTGNSTQSIKNARPRFEPVCDWSVAL